MGAKVAVIGAGSMSFGLAAVKALCTTPELDGLSLHLHDLDGGAVERMGGLARTLLAGSNRATAVAAGTDLAAALDGAAVVIISVAVDREQSWQRDREAGLARGIVHYAENGGPGALFHTARNLALILPIMRQAERSCPDAWVLNYTNPVPRICTAIHRYTRMRAIGVCHQLDFGYFMAGVLLADHLGLKLPSDCRFRWTDQSTRQAHEIARAAKAHLSILASGLNHFTWAHELKDRTGRDLYPALREGDACYDPAFEPFTRSVFRLFGRLPTPGDTHLVEFLPYTHNPVRGGWERFDIQPYDFQWSRLTRTARIALARQIIDQRRLELLEAIETERVELLVGALAAGIEYEDEALNLPNSGTLPGFDPGTIVESPARVGPSGPAPRPCPPLPPAILELCRRQATINELVVAGLVEQRRELLLQALALDPMVDDPDLPEQLLSDSGI